MKREEILADDEPDNVIGGAQTVQIPKSTHGKKLSAPAWLNDIKSEMNRRNSSRLIKEVLFKSLKEFSKECNRIKGEILF